MIGDLVMVTWTDASFDLDAPESWSEDFEVTTVGYLLERSALFVRVAGEKLPDGWRAVTSIPSAVVRSIEPLDVVWP